MANKTSDRKANDGERLQLDDLTLTLGPSTHLDGGGLAREGRTAAGAVHRVLELPEPGLPDKLPNRVAGVVARKKDGTRETFVLRALEGPTLDAVLRRREGLPLWSMNVVASLATLFQELHEAGFVFRGVLARMFAVSPQGVVTLEHPDALRRTTERASALRTVFSAPEVMSGEEGDARSDQYSLGVLTWALIAARLPPVPGELPHLRIYRPDAPHGVVTAIARATHPNPGERFESCAAFLKELQSRAWPKGVAADRLNAAAATEIGRQKKLSMPVNQDAFYVGYDEETGRGMFLVADGVSTADVGSGDLASNFVRDAVKSAWEGAVGEIFRTHKGEVPEEWMKTALEAVLEDGAARIYAYLKQPIFVGSLGPGVHPPSSTAVLAMVEGDRIMVGNVGDSRVYLLRDGAIEQLTVDQDLRTELLRAGRDPNTLGEPASLGALTQSVGGFVFLGDGTISSRPVKPEIQMHHLRKGDRLLICSDGVPDCIGDNADEIMSRELASGDDPQAIATSLCRLADDLLGGDNITALVVLA